ncbi:hypothetical protein LTR22_028386, partial [Elasticomyces elasticus]
METAPSAKAAVEQNGVNKGQLLAFLKQKANDSYKEYRRSEEVWQLDIAVKCARAGVELIDQCYGLYTAYLGILGVFLGTRYDRTGVMPDLEDAIDVAQQALFR